MGLERANRFGQLLYEAIMRLPEQISTKPKEFNQDLASELDALSLDDLYFKVIGGLDREGAVIVSQIPEPGDFSRELSGRVANIVPVDDVDTAIRSVNAYTQTIGIYPDRLKEQIRDRLALHGAQRVVSLGLALSPMLSLPQDAMEPLRRMCRWVTGETGRPDHTTGILRTRKRMAKTRRYSPTSRAELPRSSASHRGMPSISSTCRPTRSSTRRLRTWSRSSSPR